MLSVQTVVSIWTASQNRRLEKDKVKRGVEPSLARETTLSLNMRDEEVKIHPFISHSDLVVRSHRLLHTPQSTTKDSPSSSIPGRKVAESGEGSDLRLSVTHPNPANQGVDTAPEVHKREMETLDELLGHVLELESRARKLLINAFDHGSKPRLLLQADKNLMERAQSLLAPAHASEAVFQPAAERGADDSRSDLEDIQ